MSELQELLEKIGMSDNELKVYETIVAFGYRTAGQVSFKTGLTYEQAYSACESLVTKQYLKKKMVTSKEGTIYFPLAPKISISADISQRLAERLNNLSTTISEIWSKTEKNIDGDTQKLISDIKTLLEEYSLKIKQLGDNHRSSISTWSENTIFEMKDTTTEAVDEFKAEVTQPMQAMIQQLNELNENLQGISKKSIQEIQTKTDAHQTSIEGAVNSIKNELEEFADEIGLLVNGRISSLNQELQTKSEHSNDQGAEIIKQLKSKFAELSKSQSELISSINTSFFDTSQASFSGYNEELKNKTDHQTEKFASYIDEIISTNSSIRDRTIHSTREIIGKLHDRQVSEVEGLQNSFISTLDSIQNDAVKQLGAILESTGEKLNILQDNLTNNLGAHQERLQSQLNDLTANVKTELANRFSSIEQLLKGFIDSLKNSTQDNVANATSSIQEITAFLQQFLDELKGKISSDMQVLATEVASKLENILGSSQGKLDEHVQQYNTQISELSSSIVESVDLFQVGINELLTNVKQDLQARLSEAQEKFKQGVDHGVEAYETQAASIRELQSKQMDEIGEEVNSLSTEADQAQSSIISLINDRLEETKTQRIEQLSLRVDEDVDKLNRELSRFNERLSRELRSFYTRFSDETVGLRDNVPRNIENFFADQEDRFQNFKRDFERNEVEIRDFLNLIEENLEPGDKNWKRKEFQNDFYQRARRIRDDFTRFESSMKSHFDIVLEDTEIEKNDVLAGFNKTIQEEINSLDDMIENRSKEISDIGNDFLNSMETNKTQLSDDMEESVSDTLEDLKSQIRKELLSKFEQPLESIISKAKAVATGTEGIDQENRIIKAQNLLVEKIGESIDTLVSSLQQAFEESIHELDTKVEGSIKESEEISLKLKNDLNSSLEEQRTNINSTKSEIQGQLDGLRNSINDNLNDSIKSTLGSVSTTFGEKSTEVDQTVSSKTEELNTTTSSKLQEVDDALDEFIQNLRIIQDETNDQVRTTVDGSVNQQKQSMETTMNALKEATHNAHHALETTQSSLSDNIGESLNSMGSEIRELVNTYETAISTTSNALVDEIGEYYQTEGKFEELEAVKEEISRIAKEYKTNLDNIGSSLINELTDNLNNLTAKRNESLKEFFGKFDQITTELAETNSNFILDVFDLVSTQLSSSQAEIIGSVENAKSNIDNTVTNSIETVRTDILSPANEIVNSINSESTSISGNLIDLSSRLEEIRTQEENIIDKARTRIMEKLDQKIKREEENWIEKTNNLYGNQSSTLNDHAVEFESTVSKMTGEGKVAVATEINKIPTVVEETLDAAAKSMALLNEISQGAIELDPDTPDTSYFDVSKDAIVANLNALLERTKSNVLIVAPTLSWLNPEIVANFSRVTVKIVIDPEQITPADEEILQKFKDSNVQPVLRKLDRNRYRRDLDMIMATRDREEVILAKGLNTQDPYAFVSQDDYFIEKFSELFGIFQTMPEFKFD